MISKDHTKKLDIVKKNRKIKSHSCHKINVGENALKTRDMVKSFGLAFLRRNNF
jgi:hypothetical protein